MADPKTPRCIEVADSVEEIVFSADRPRVLKARFKRVGRDETLHLLKITRKGGAVLV